jgi:hypothetical protein
MSANEKTVRVEGGDFLLRSIVPNPKISLTRAFLRIVLIHAWRRTADKGRNGRKFGGLPSEYRLGETTRRQQPRICGQQQ